MKQHEECTTEPKNCSDQRKPATLRKT